MHYPVKGYKKYDSAGKEFDPVTAVTAILDMFFPTVGSRLRSSSMQSKLDSSGIGTSQQNQIIYSWDSHIRSDRSYRFH
jgi:hypothetical protein